MYIAVKIEELWSTCVLSPDTVRVERSVLALQFLTPLLGAVLLLRALHNAHLLLFPC